MPDPGERVREAGREPGDSQEVGDFTTTDSIAADVFAFLTAVRDDHDLPALALAVAFTVSQHFNRKSREAWPGHKRIAELVGRDERSVRPVVKALIDRGHLIVAKSWGDGQSTRYRLPSANRKETSGSPAENDASNRKETSGSQGVEGRANRTKTSGSDGLGGGANRKETSEQTGRKRPVNHMKEPLEGESAAPPRSGSGQANGSAVLADRGHAPARPQVVPAVVADGVSDHVDFPIPQHVADESDRRRALERGWRALVGCEPVLADLDAGPLHDAIAAGAVTVEDVTQGIREAMAKPGFRIRAWRQLVGFATTAAKNRMGASPKAVPAFADAEPQRPADAVQVPSGGFRTREQFAEARRRWDDGFTWDEGQFGFPPDSEFTHTPEDLRGPRRRRPAALDRPADAVQPEADQSIASTGVQP